MWVTKARKIQRLNSKFILVRIRNTDHVLRVKDEEEISESPPTEKWQWWLVVFPREGGGGCKWSGCMVSYNVQWMTLEGKQVTLQQQGAALTISTGKLQQQGDYALLKPRPLFRDSPVTQSRFYSIKPSCSWNEKQKAQWFSTHSRL